MFLNKVTDMFYIGSAFNFENRWKNHKIELRLNRHCNPYLQSAWNKYGEESFKFYVLEYVDKTDLISREQFWIDKLKAYDREIGYNLCQTAGNVAGRKASEETKVLLSTIRKGKKRSEEFKEKIRQSWKTRVVSEEAKKNMSLAHIGNKPSTETRAKMSASKIGNQINKGRKQSPEQIAKRLATRAKNRLDLQRKLWA